MMSTLKVTAARLANAALRPLGAEVVPARELRELREQRGGVRFVPQSLALPEGARDYLRPDNPRLTELRGRYRGHPASVHSQWSEAGDYLRRELDIVSFRSDSAYLYQRRMATDAQYLLAAYYARAHDALGLWDRLTDDDLFGNYTVEFDEGRRVSRDLTDSVIEINFLGGEVGLDGAAVLDVGAGYGRLGHRASEGLPGTSFFCTDAVPESTFLSEYYLRFRGSRAGVVPLDEVEGFLKSRTVDLVTNIHSFSECTLASVEWWLGQFAANGVRRLFLVPNTPEPLTTEADGSRVPLLPHIERRGYRLAKKAPKYAESGAARHAPFAATYYLFELRP